MSTRFDNLITGREENHSCEIGTTEHERRLVEVSVNGSMDRMKNKIRIFCRYVDAHPPWAKKLEAHLAPGIHTILFKARSPNSNLNDVCRTILTVKGF